MSFFRLGSRAGKMGSPPLRSPLFRRRRLSCGHPTVRAVSCVRSARSIASEGVRRLGVGQRSSAGPLIRSDVHSHVVLTSYNVITSPDFNEFKKIGRWETVIIE